MLKRFLIVTAITVLPIAACGQADNAPPAGTAPNQAANPAASQPTSQAPEQGQPAGQPQPATPAPANTSAGPADRKAPTPGETRNPVSKLVDDTPQFREVTLPAGTLLPVELQTAVNSASSNVEDPVRATLRRTLTIDGQEALPAGATLRGVVTDVQRSGRVKGLAHVALRFSSLAARDEQIEIRTATIGRTAEPTKKQDAAKIGIGAGAGAVIGGIVGGGSGAAKGAAIGGAGGTGVVLATRGKEVALPVGANLSVKLLEPVTVRVPIAK